MRPIDPCSRLEMAARHGREFSPLEDHHGLSTDVVNRQRRRTRGTGPYSPLNFAVWNACGPHAAYGSAERSNALINWPQPARAGVASAVPERQFGNPYLFNRYIKEAPCRSEFSRFSRWCP